MNVLIDNACKHSQPGTPITVRLRRDDSGVSVEVEDRGYGIAAVDVPQLFTPFFRSPDSRLTVYQTLGKISEMMKGFIVGNFVIGLFMAVTSATAFAFLHLPYFYFLGLISGFLSLVPYLGVILATLPPLASGAGVLHGSGFAIVVALILGLHVFAMNVLYPKVLGGRLELNPLAVTLGLLIWGWLWGAMGLILAVPVVGAIKIVCDNVRGLEPFGQLLGVGASNKN